MPSCIRRFHRTCRETTVGLTTKMCYFIGHGRTNKVLVKVVNKDQAGMLLAHFSESLCVLESFGLSWKPWMLLVSHCALLTSLQCKVERWKKEIPDPRTMLQNTHIYHAQISREVPHQADTNTDSQMCNSDQSNNKNRLWFTTACNNKQSISKDPPKHTFSVETYMVLLFQPLTLKHFCHFCRRRVK